ncbi:MAG TPA: hypothetical protein VM553_13820, partial [Dongiaceae bacterium]|nr:hypothetical protein [Dongiaceae bacterium]
MPAFNTFALIPDRVFLFLFFYLESVRGIAFFDLVSRVFSAFTVVFDAVCHMAKRALQHTRFFAATQARLSFHTPS